MASTVTNPVVHSPKNPSKGPKAPQGSSSSSTAHDKLKDTSVAANSGVAAPVVEPPTSVFEVSDEILKKHLPEGMDMLASRYEAFSKLTQELEQDYVTARRNEFKPTKRLTTAGTGATTKTNLSASATATRGAGLTPAGVIQQAQTTLQQCADLLLQDLDRITSDMTQLLVAQDTSVAALTSDVQLLTTRLAHIQRHHYSECLTVDMTTTSTAMKQAQQLRVVAPTSSSAPSAAIGKQHTRDGHGVHGVALYTEMLKRTATLYDPQAAVLRTDEAYGGSVADSDAEVIRDLPLSEVLPAELWRRWQQYEDEQARAPRLLGDRLASSASLHQDRAGGGEPHGPLNVTFASTTQGGTGDGGNGSGGGGRAKTTTTTTTTTTSTASSSSAAMAALLR
eukprot:gene6173-4433_t